MEFDTDDIDEYWAQFDRDIEHIAAMCASNASDDHLARWCNKTPKRTAPWTGHQKTMELLESINKDRLQEQLRMPLRTFQKLVEFCVEYTALRSSAGTTIEEKLYMFLYIIGQGASSRGCQEAFQCSG